MKALIRFYRLLQFRSYVTAALLRVGEVEGVISFEEWAEYEKRGYRILVGYGLPFRGHIYNKPFGAAMFFFPCDMTEPQDEAKILRRLYAELSHAQRRIVIDQSR